VAFTHLNRLVAPKCLEVRDLIPEIITARDAYGGRSKAHRDYRNAHPDEARGADDALPAAIRHACQGVYAEFKFLFDVGDPATGQEPPVNSVLWPDHPVLKECIGLINGLDEAAENTGRTLWAEDEIIGWIYQFYNAEHKEAVRKRGRPRRPAEVAVINQFFTPRWICKFLVDNTLGRLWLEMHPDSERVRAKCDYLVPEPLGADGDEDGRAKRQGDRGFRLDSDSPINDSKASPRREPKRPQDIRLIDPACGTMHFGHYGFEVFQEIYRDARDHSWMTSDDAYSVGSDQADGRLAIFRAEAQAVKGNGKLHITGAPSRAARDGIQTAHTYLKTNTSRLGLSKNPSDYDLHTQLVNLMGVKEGSEVGMAFFVAMIGALLNKPVQEQLVILGEMSSRGGLQPVGSLTERLQLAMDNGARRVLLPLENKREFVDIPGDVLDKLQNFR